MIDPVGGLLGKACKDQAVGGFRPKKGFWLGARLMDLQMSSFLLFFKGSAG